MSSGDNVPVQEIVIIRRKHGDGDDGHHGGMWKIAFADFMTAMMAFFLVMWLLSASDEKTLDQLATYFNPIKLPDSQKSEKVLQIEGDSGAPEKADEHKVAKAEKNDPKSKQSLEDKEKPHDGPDAKQKIAEEALFADPYGVLARIATQMVKLPTQMQGVRKDDTTNFSGGAAFRDPFDPDFRKRSPDAQDNGMQQDNMQLAGPSKSGSSNSGTSRDAPDEGGEHPKAPIASAPASGPLDDGKTSGQSIQARLNAMKTHPGALGVDSVFETEGAGEKASSSKGAADAAASPTDGAKTDPGKENAEAAQQLEADIKETLRQAGVPDLPDINVERTTEGILISLTDRLNFEMFGLSSATPRSELVVAMEKIGKLLQARPERIVVRGHTDSRPFRGGGAYDNWRLSTDRAHIVHYMLARGGLAEKRFERIEGYADRELKMPDDPKAAANRRIEILLRQPMS